MDKCECAGTGWIGDNGPGKKGNNEYHPCPEHNPTARTPEEELAALKDALAEEKLAKVISTLAGWHPSAGCEKGRVIARAIRKHCGLTCDS